MKDIDEMLKRNMEEALLVGDKDKALKLSQELDPQVVEAQRLLNFYRKNMGDEKNDKKEWENCNTCWTCEHRKRNTF